MISFMFVALRITIFSLCISTFSTLSQTKQSRTIACCFFSSFCIILLCPVKVLKIIIGTHSNIYNLLVLFFTYTQSMCNEDSRKKSMVYSQEKGWIFIHKCVSWPMNDFVCMKLSFKSTIPPQAFEKSSVFSINVLNWIIIVL